MTPEITIRQATKEDITLIRDLAQIIFPHTYGSMLSQEQIDYMMEWMYSPKNIGRIGCGSGVFYCGNGRDSGKLFGYSSSRG